MKRSLWSAGFIALFLFELILGVTQQVRLTSQEAEAEKRIQAERLKSEGESRYLVGKLDTIGQFEAAFAHRGAAPRVSNDSGDRQTGSIKAGDEKTIEQALARAVLSASQVSTSAAGTGTQVSAQASGFSTYSNQQLRGATLDFASRLRSLEAATRASMGMDSEGKQYQAALQATGIRLLDALCGRLAPQPCSMSIDGHGPGYAKAVIENGVVAGTDPLTVASHYLEALAQRLPSG